MPLDQIANIAEICAAALVIVSLIYVGLQVRQNTQATRLETVRAIASGFNSFYDVLASNRELADIWHRGAFNFQSLDETEKVRFTLTVMRVFRTTHQQFFEWREGAIDTENWQAITALFADAMRLPGWQEVWSRRKHHLTKEFQEYVDKFIAESKDAKPLYDPPTS